MDNRESLRRLMIAFCKQVSTIKSPETLSDEELLDVASAGFEKSSILSVLQLLKEGKGGLPHAFAIKIQKERVDVKEMVVQVLSLLDSHGLLLAFLSALPAVGLLYGSINFLRRYVPYKTKNLLIHKELLDDVLDIFEFYVDVLDDDGSSETQISQIQPDQVGLALCALDRLYSLVERDGNHSKDWMTVRSILSMLAQPGVENRKKRAGLRRLKEIYDRL